MKMTTKVRMGSCSGSGFVYDILEEHEDSYLVSTHDNGFGTVIVLQHALGIATFAVWAPVGLLGVIWLKHVLTLHLQGDHQEGAWIRIRLTGLTEFDVARHVGLSKRTRNKKFSIYVKRSCDY